MHFSNYSQTTIVTTSGNALIADGGFETPVVTGTLANPTGTAWTYAGGGQEGVVSNAPNAPSYEGNQSAFLNNVDATPPSISQTVMLDTGNYNFNYYVWGPGWEAKTQPLILKINSNVTDATFTADGTWHKVTVPLKVSTKSNYTFTFTFNATGSQNYSSLDKVSLDVLSGTPPTQPTGLVSSNINQSGFTLSWTASTDNVGVASYEIFAGGVSKGTSTTTSFALTGLSPLTSYSMTVTAKDASGNVSAASSALNVTTGSVDNQAPTAPTGLVASVVKDSSFIFIMECIYR